MVAGIVGERVGNTPNREPRRQPHVRGLLDYLVYVEHLGTLMSDEDEALRLEAARALVDLVGAHSHYEEWLDQAASGDTSLSVDPATQHQVWRINKIGAMEQMDDPGERASVSAEMAAGDSLLDPESYEQLLEARRHITREIAISIGYPVPQQR